MSDHPPTPATPPEPESTGKLRFTPAVIVVLLALFVGAVVLFTSPVALWFLAVVPILGGALHAAGHASDVKARRFFKAFFITLGILVVGVIVVGICVSLVVPGY